MSSDQLARVYPHYIINLHEEAEVEMSLPKWVFSPRAKDIIRHTHSFSFGASVQVNLVYGYALEK